MRATPASPGPERILVRGVNWLGDAVMTTPALRRLREELGDTALANLTRERLLLPETRREIGEVALRMGRTR